MVNYQLGKIYKIVDNTNNNIYIGSTCEPTLARRLATHLTDYKRREIRNNNMTSLQIFDNNNYDIILIENYPCERKDELHARERYYIESLECVNKQFPGRTQKEYREVNKEYIRAKDHEYYLNNIESKTRYRNENKELIKQTQQKYRNKNKELIKQTQHEYYLNNKELIKQTQHEYYLNNKETLLEKCKQYRNENKELIKQQEEKRNIKVFCICGKYRDRHKTRHEQTKFHKNYINNLCTIQS